MVIVVIIIVVVLMVVPAPVIAHMHIEFHAFDGAFGGSLRMQVILIQAKPFQLMLQLMERNAQIEHGANEHVAADPAKNIQVKCLHRPPNALI